MKLNVTIGGSHRKFNRQMDALQPFADGLPLRTRLYGKLFTLTITDSPEARETMKRVGATVSRWQPDWLNE
jgi:hypothetical protein